MTPERITEHIQAQNALLHPIFPWRDDAEGLRFIDDWAANLDKGLTLEEAYGQANVCMVLRRHTPASEITARLEQGRH